MVKIFQKIKELKDQIESLSLSTIDILTLEEAVTYLQVSKSYLYKLTFKKEIPFYKPSGKLIYFKKSELDEWIFKNRESNNEETTEVLFNNLKKKKYGNKN